MGSGGGGSGCQLIILALKEMSWLPGSRRMELFPQ